MAKIPPTGLPACLSALCALATAAAAFDIRLPNFNAKGQPVVRFDVAGDAVDAHDGEIALFEGRYWLYGTSYDCGFQWQAPGRPFCGFKAYSSTDMVHWTDEGYLFDAKAKVWQDRCDGGTYGCYRPHVIRHPGTGKYVLWVNVYDNRVGFRVFTADRPQGPFMEGPEPVLAVNYEAPVRGVNNGDHDTFLDEDGKAYLAYTDWRTGGTLVIERLSDSFLTGTGQVVKAVTPGTTEAPALFRRGDRYYITYSDPNCGYCTTGTSYRTAASPLGPWSEGKKISSNSCGGQPAFVTPLRLASGTGYLYGSDLWNNGAKNEALANYFWGLLDFSADGTIGPLACAAEQVLSLVDGSPGAPLPAPADLDNSPGDQGFSSFCDVKAGIRRAQSFTARRTGTLSEISFTAFRDGIPTAALLLDVHRADEAHRPIGDALYSRSFPGDSLGWSPRTLEVKPGIRVSEGERYVLVIRSETTQGCYGFAYRDGSPVPGGGALYAKDGAAFGVEGERVLKFRTRISQPTAAGRSIAAIRAAPGAGVDARCRDALGAMGERGLGRFRSLE